MPSTGSITHVRPEVPGREVPSSPTIASSGRSAASRSTISRSAAVSAWVTMSEPLVLRSTSSPSARIRAASERGLAHQVGGEGGVGGRRGVDPRTPR